MNNSNEKNPSYITFICPICKVKEDIPFYIVDMMDRTDNGNDEYPPRFKCQHCRGKMEPLYYKNYKGKIYQYKG